MKLFQSIQVYFAFLGIKPSQNFQKYPFNATNLVILTIFVQFSVGTTAFIVYDAKSFKQLADAFYPTSLAITATLNFIFIICNSSKVYKFIENYENTIKISKKKYFYL